MLTENASKIQQKYLGAKGLIVTDRCGEYVCTVVDRFNICRHCRR